MFLAGGQMACSDRKMAEYLRCAIDADALAKRITDPEMKKHWHEIACGYRNLAQARQYLTTDAFEFKSAAPLQAPQAELAK
jgi:hypothetical protein